MAFFIWNEAQVIQTTSGIDATVELNSDHDEWPEEILDFFIDAAERRNAHGDITFRGGVHTPQQDGSETLEVHFSIRVDESTPPIQLEPIEREILDVFSEALSRARIIGERLQEFAELAWLDRR